MADVLLINMWTTDIGRYGASNYGLLKVIFESNLKLFDQSSQKKLLFVLRDYDDRIGFATIKDMLDKDVKQIWSEIYKPEKWENSQPGDFFDFEYCALPHKMFQPDAFNQACLDLRTRFQVDATNTLFLSDSEQKNVPVDGVPIFISQTWEVIRQQKDLNLPDQREIVANFRCNEIKEEAYNAVQQDISDLEKLCGSKVLENFKEKCEDIVNKATNSYGSASKQYDKTVVNKIRDDLVNQIHS